MSMSFLNIFTPSAEKKFADLIRPHLQHLYHQAYRFTNNQDDAEDLVQDLLLSLYAKKMDLGNIEKPANWLLRSLYHQFVDNYRKKNRLPIDHRESKSDEIINELSSDVAAPHQIHEQKHTAKQLNDAIKQLNPDQQALIFLHDVEGHTLTELSNILDLPLGTLKSRLHRARKTVREQLLLPNQDKNTTIVEPFIKNNRFTG